MNFARLQCTRLVDWMIFHFDLMVEIFQLLKKKISISQLLANNFTCKKKKKIINDFYYEFFQRYKRILIFIKNLLQKRSKSVFFLIVKQKFHNG